MSIKTFKLCLIIFFSLGVVRSMEIWEGKFFEGNMYTRFPVKSDHKAVKHKKIDENNSAISFDFLNDSSEEEDIIDPKRQMDNIKNNKISDFIEKNQELVNSYLQTKQTINYNNAFDSLFIYLEDKLSKLDSVMARFQNNNNKIENPNDIIQDIISFLTLNEYALNVIDFLSIYNIKEQIYYNNYRIMNNYLMLYGYQLFMDQNNFLTVIRIPKTNYSWTVVQTPKINYSLNSQLLQITKSPSKTPINNPVTRHNIQILELQSSNITIQMEDRIKDSKKKHKRHYKKPELCNNQ